MSISLVTTQETIPMSNFDNKGPSRDHSKTDILGYFALVILESLYHILQRPAIKSF